MHIADPQPIPVGIYLYTQQGARIAKPTEDPASGEQGGASYD